MNRRPIDYDALLASVLRQNALILFDLSGAAKPLDCSRHLDAVQNVARKPRATHLQLVVDLWASWEMHLERSSYSLPHIGAVHIEARWMRWGRGSPPCVLMMNDDFRSKEEVSIPCPVSLEWKAVAALGPLRWTESRVKGVGTCYRAYRQCT